MGYRPVKHLELYTMNINSAQNHIISAKFLLAGRAAAHLAVAPGHLKGGGKYAKIYET